MVVTDVAGGGADIVVVRCVVVVCVCGSDPQAASSAVPPRRVIANNRRLPIFVSVMMYLLGQGRIGRGLRPIQRSCYWVLVEVVPLVVVTEDGAGYVVVLVVESDATPLVLP